LIIVGGGRFCSLHRPPLIFSEDFGMSRCGVQKQ
jgi:hypothetical protein